MEIYDFCFNNRSCYHHFLEHSIQQQWKKGYNKDGIDITWSNMELSP